MVSYQNVTFRMTPDGFNQKCKYIVDYEWFNHWQMFVTNQKSGVNRTYKSKIEGVGVLDPGPIDNRNLFDQNGQIRDKLVLEQDYTVLEEPVWDFLWKHYGGGPIIRRKDYSIYSEAIDASDKERDYHEVS